MSKIYIDEIEGFDSSSQVGSMELPYKTLKYAMKTHDENSNEFFVRCQSSSGKCFCPVKKSCAKNNCKIEKCKIESEEISDSMTKMLFIDKQECSDETSVKYIRLYQAPKHIGQVVEVKGWIHRLRLQKDMCFLTLRDGSEFLQIVFVKISSQHKKMQQLTLESTISVKGLIKEIPKGKEAPQGIEMKAESYSVFGLAPSGLESFSNKIQENTDPSILLDQRHLFLRGETLSSVIKIRAAVFRSIRSFYDSQNILEVTPPCLVQTQVEGGLTLFKLNYFNETAYLTQSSQLYLETCLPSLGNVYTQQQSFRAEKSHTRRHLAEYTHIEAELSFISFEQLLTHVENLIVKSLLIAIQDKAVYDGILKLNPNFSIPSTPFLKMTYQDTLDWLNKHNILNENGKAFKFGDDIAESAERKMTDILNVPVFLINFPAELKSFYMKRCSHDQRLTESFDLLFPNVGEVIGGSMRIDNEKDFNESMKRENLDTVSYLWYIDQAKYGSCPHGGYGLGSERFIAWVCNRFTVRDCCLYPRFSGRCKP